ncbi:MAG: hypothetical protein AB7I38_11010 [Dehalococcoidia bacterium]
MKNAIDTVERLLCERYNVRSLDGLGALPGAIAAARGGDLGPLRAALEGRDLYQWRRGIEAALAEAEGEIEAEPAPEPKSKPKRAPRGKSDTPAEPESEGDQPPGADAEEAGQATEADEASQDGEEPAGDGGAAQQPDEPTGA